MSNLRCNWKINSKSCLLCFIKETEATTLAPMRLKKCSKCPPGWGTSKKCTQHSDTKCIKCTRGKTYSPRRSKRPCLPCSHCGVGLYESHKCTPIRDTICSECVAYLDHKNLTNRNDFLEKCNYLFLK